MKGLELISFHIISAVGTARSCYIEAIKAARNKDFKKAEQLIKEGNEVFVQGHLAHSELIQQEADGEHINSSLLFIHAEDQLMSAETFKILAEELIQTYKLIHLK